MSISIIFFGTHHFAATILQGLLDDQNISIDHVITQPDKPVGRIKELQKPPVKILAEKHNLTFDQPKSLKKIDLGFRNFDLGVTAQYGKLLSNEVIEAPKHGTLNVHTSLLPKYRGASPIQSALINGETKTGVTIMKMDQGLDTGPILFQKELNIDPDDTYPQLDVKLAKIGSQALLKVIPMYISGDIMPSAQDNSHSTTCKQFNRDDGRIDWNKSAENIYNLYRGLTPWPGVWTTINGKRLKLIRIKLSNTNLNSGEVSNKNDMMLIGATNGSIEVLELQLEGKKLMDAKTFLQGNKSLISVT
jgi:methionyl-tRNA formyltransferase